MEALQDSNISIHYDETPNHVEITNHYHNSHEILYIIDGSVIVTINNKTYQGERGDMIFISNLEAHNVKVTSYPYKRFYLLVNPIYLHGFIKDPLLTSILKHRSEHFYHIVRLTMDQKEIITYYMKKMYSEQVSGEDYSENMIAGYLQMLLISLFRNNRYAFPLKQLNPTRNIIFEIQKYMDENLTEEITLEEISKKFYMNRFYLSHQFKEVTGYSFKEYLILQRLSRAKHLLFHTLLDITDVGIESGFHNVNHFIRIFKKYEKTTPYQYRKNCYTSGS